MATLRDIRRRIDSVKNTQIITRAMQMVAAAKLRRAQENALMNRPYSERMMEVLRSLSLRTTEESHPLLERREIKNVRLVVVSAERGLCGAFNNNVLTRAEWIVREGNEKNLNTSLVLVGIKAKDYFKRRKYTPYKKYIDVLNKVEFSLASEIGKDIVNSYKKREIDEVRVVYTRFVSMIKQEVNVETLLPIQPMEEKEEESIIEYIYEPDEQRILEEILPRYIKVQIYKAMLESVASEQAARMTAMEAATKNAGELIESLTLSYNKARQASITKEMLDIVGGSEALR
ncbi:MAG: ATP synthase F1 subunit gamma [Thermodesulfobacteriota bacterium]|nr:ATP synthase F1 subunit gamma [Thermodesulfobacteriota bacterium]